MTTPIRKKRNFKALQLQSPPTSPATTATNPIPAPLNHNQQSQQHHHGQLHSAAPAPAPTSALPAIPREPHSALPRKQPEPTSALPAIPNLAMPTPPSASTNGPASAGVGLGISGLPPLGLNATRAPPSAGGRKRPPPMTFKAPKLPPTTTSHNPTAPSPAASAASAASALPPSSSLTVEQGPDPPSGSLSAEAAGSSMASRRNTYHATLSSTLAKLGGERENVDGVEGIKFELKNEDLKDLKELGQGNGGSVKMAEHIPTGMIMAKKIVLIDAKPSVRKQILRELQIMHNCHSPYIVSFYGAYLADPNICICMEFADKGSLDGIYKQIGAIEIGIVAKVAFAVLEGLTYLYDVHRIIHRDIKPSNILCNSRGEIKICDFGVSGELINSIADTFVGTSTYMSPERIQGAPYTVKSDVWSVGISLIELALGRFPFSESSSDDSDLSDLSDAPRDDDLDFANEIDKMQREIEELGLGQGGEVDPNETLSPARPGSMASISALSIKRRSKRASSKPLPPRKKKPKVPGETKDKKDKRKSKGVSLQGGGMTMSILELLQHIVNEPAPSLANREDLDGERRFSEEAVKFVDACLLKDPDTRLAPKELLAMPWMDLARGDTIDVQAWAATF